MSINIINANNATTVHINGCGCGSSGIGSSGDGQALPPGGTEGGATYDGQARVIDICANVDIFIDAINDYIDQAQILQYVPGVGQLNAGLEAISNVSLQELEALENELTDPKVTEALKRWVVRLFDDPFPGFTRESLRTLTFRLPLVVGGTLFMPIWRVWAETANIEQLNAQILATAGSASYDGECAELQRSVGRDPYRPPSLPPSDQTEYIDSANGLKYTRVYSQSVPPGEERFGAVAGDITDFVALLISYEANNTGGISGTAYRGTTDLTLPDATTTQFQSTRTRQGLVDNPSVRIVQGRATAGADAEAFDGALFPGFGAASGGLPPEITSTPVSGATAFSHDIDFSEITSGFGGNNYTVWVVTSDTGGVTLAGA